MTRTELSRAPRWLAGVLLLATGCGQSGRPADPGTAETALHAALDAWKAGASPADLARRSAPIHVSDVDWNGGLRLVAYKAGDAGRLVGFDMSYPVVLQLKGPRGKVVTKTAVYVVTTSPQLLVLRQEG